MKARPADFRLIPAGNQDARANAPDGETTLLWLARLAARALEAPMAIISGPELAYPICVRLDGTEPDANDVLQNHNTRTVLDFISASEQILLIGDIGANGVGHPTGSSAAHWGSGAIAYAGVPLHSATGAGRGALCVVDSRPRNWSDADRKTLAELADTIEAVPPFSNPSSIDARLHHALKLEAIGRLAGGIAHDFNNILTAIRGHTELLLADLRPGDPDRFDLEAIRSSAERAALLTDQLLAFGQKLVLQPRILDINSLLPGWIATIREHLETEVDLQLEIEPGLRPVKVDPERLEIAIRAIITNALEAVGNKGKILVTVGNVTLYEPFIRESAGQMEPGPYLRISITDDGEGMDEPTLQRIFEPFFTTRKPPLKVGLGLSTAYGIVRQSGGYIQAESTPGVGTRIVVYLPAHRE